MSPFVIIVGIGCSAGLFYLLLKHQKLNLLNKAIKENDVDKILTLVEDRGVKKVFSKYTLDLYKAKAFFLKKDDAGLKQHLREMFQNQYEIDDEKQYLTLYYHVFIQCKDLVFLEEMLKYIHQNKDMSFIQHCEWAKAILLHDENGYVKAISDAIDEKMYNGFLLGSAVYFIALQKKRLGKEEEAREWFIAASEVLQPKDFYFHEVENEITEKHKI